MKTMDFEQFYYSFGPPYMNQLHECISENAFPFQTENLLSPNTFLDEMFDQEYSMEGLLQQHANNQEDFGFLKHDDPLETEFCHGFSPSAEENMHVSMEEGDSCLKGIQAELMEETSLADLLLTGAEAVEAQNWPLASDIIEKLNNASSLENGDGLLNRLALFFTQSLYYKSTNAPELLQCGAVSTHTNAFCVFQVLQELSPYVKFAHFTANQAILEATEGAEDLHIIDFDIMEGIQWPPLMVDLAMKKSVNSLRVTAITVNQRGADSVQQTGRRLKEFAASINFPFMFDQLMMEREEDFQGIELGQTLIVNCMIHQWMPNRSFSLVKTFLDGVTKLSPRLVVLVEEELFNFPRLKSMSFVEFFCEALHHYTALCDSLASNLWGSHKMELSLIEKEVIGLRILDSVRQFPCERKERMVWEEGFYSLKGFKRVPMSTCNISQAKFLVSLFGGGYWVQYEKGRLALCWKSRPLTVASIWEPMAYLDDKVK
ncbi:hypothetical protein GLYMA_08G146900v4 [Glycine max]|uniref:Uncharacterized protein n=2 Tax=Glycine subgen. Soja TaxID=1462606 RepID=K7L6R7_SOYBN|nr:protein NODULATION SIGNALING PATHWAY 2 [Glycine max]XP_028247136.1 nodulation-signaling pathway 2 protein-like [Glycine soja]KAG5015713.1 hypothetical protein JHK85_021849 [Glycine max]KAG5025493.1 hypothetical protein JHK86_021407 [Glycine max]KAH1237202.1 Nodulation-signaling pathway 2 protein [Glycine max]KRH43393.1 hypothetical protein GLYMA_08G146900v4 [Glycine max]RZB96951.1 Nodulation-signaling pathway 2 protein [Glycine soja]|eukprot:XP_003532857.2 nodulation-signaling pathway 2 protein [Glycine max]